MAEVTQISANRARPVHGPIFYLGALGLLATATVGFIAVVARHLGRVMLGDIELSQAAILLASSAALLAATLSGQHARVHLLRNRLSGPWQRRMQCLSDVLGALFGALLSAGSVWILHDQWHTHEESELLHLPYAPLRALTCIVVILITLWSVRRAVRVSVSS